MSEIDQLKAGLACGTITRREFITRMSALGAAATIPGALFSNAALAAPKKGGRLKMGKAHGQTTDTLDPATYENGFTIALAHAAHGYMVEVAPDGSVQPGLAESWESSPDAAVWTFKLRNGVTFHSGKSLTTEDVIASINYHRGEGSTSAAGPLVAEIQEIHADGADKVVFYPCWWQR